MPRAPLTPMARLRWPLILEALARRPAASDVVEFGHGQGAVAQRLAPRYRLYRGYEPDPESHAVAAQRSDGVPSADLRGELSPADTDHLFDIACAFEVLEHLEDDRAALSEWRSWLKEGGMLILSVPAHQHRFGPADTLVGHYRRYSRQDLSSLLGEAGFVDIEVRSYGFPLGFLLEAVRNRLASRQQPSSKAEGTAVSGRFLQPRAWLGDLIAAAVWPFTLIQRPFFGTDIGTGFVASAVRGPDIQLP